MKQKITNMNTTEILNQFFKERNSSKNTQYAYLQSIRLFEKYTQQSLSSIIYLAETEQDNNTAWKHQTLKMYLIQFREYVFKKYKLRSAEQHLHRVISVFRHFEITVEKLPYFSTKNANPSLQINPDKMVDRQILRLCINMNNPLLKAIVLFMSSSGMSKTDTLNLTVEDFINATYEYHNTLDLNSALQQLSNLQNAIGFWENLQRQKTGQVYFTFSSHESTTAIVQYLLTREKLTLNSPLFSVHKKYLSDLFKNTNDRLGLGKNGQYSRFASHMLRRYHATQLFESGMSESKIDLLQGRKQRNIIHASYVKIKPSKLKQEYINALPYLVIEDTYKVKSELENVKDELTKVTIENKELKKQNERINNLEKVVLRSLSDDKISKLKEII